jgi:hypothetical protein
MTPDAPNRLIELLESREMPNIARATAALELGVYVEPEGDVIESLKRALGDRDPQIRAAAVISLQGMSGDSLIGALAPLLDDKTRLVRTEAARVLAPNQNELRNEERVAMKKAIQECIDAAAADSDRAAGHLMLGVLFENLDDLDKPEEAYLDKAEEAYATAMRIEPATAGPRTNLAAIYDRVAAEAAQRAQEATQAANQAEAAKQYENYGILQNESRRLREEELGLLERDALLVPDNAGIMGRIGLARHLGGWQKEAESALLTAHLLDPRNPDHAFRLAIYYRDTGRPGFALPLAEQLVEQRPNNEMFAQFLGELRQMVGP